MHKNELESILKTVGDENMGLIDLLKILAILEKIPFFKAYTFFNILIPVFVLIYLLSFKYTIRISIVDKNSLNNRGIKKIDDENKEKTKKKNPFEDTNDYL